MEALFMIYFGIENDNSTWYNNNKQIVLEVF